MDETTLQVIKHFHQATPFCFFVPNDMAVFRRGTLMQGRQSIVKIGGPKRRGGLGDGSPPAGSRGRAPGGGLGPLGAKPPEAKGHYRIKFEF